MTTDNTADKGEYLPKVAAMQQAAARNQDTAGGQVEHPTKTRLSYEATREAMLIFDRPG